MVLWLGLYPQPFLNIITPAVKELVANHQSWQREGTLLAQKNRFSTFLSGLNVSCLYERGTSPYWNDSQLNTQTSL